MKSMICALVVLFVLVCGQAGSAAPGPVRAQLDTVGFAVDREDFARVLYAARQAEGLDDPGERGVRRGAWPAAAVILPHDDYLYAGRTAVHALPYLQARRWVVFGVCHACRRIGVRDDLLFDDYDAWRIAGREFPVDKDLRAVLRERLGDDAVVTRERHAREHSIEALLPWIGAAAGDYTFVPILVPGMEPDRLDSLSARVAGILADVCHQNGWVMGRDLAIAISADAVHYGCDGWGDHPYNVFGCDEAGHAAARAQDITLAEATLAGPLTTAGIHSFIRLVWDTTGPEYPAYPYRITWCGLYSIPFGLSVARQWRNDMGAAPLTGDLVHYGDSITDGRLECDVKHLGVTAPNTLRHWVGYPAVVYR